LTFVSTLANFTVSHGTPEGELFFGPATPTSLEIKPTSAFSTMQERKLNFSRFGTEVGLSHFLERGYLH
jgi:hypothetical protein